MKKVVLAYSGGLDTSVCVRWLTDKGYTVIAVIADIGQKVDFAKLRERAISAGAKEIYVADLKKRFVEEFILPTLKAEGVYQGYYLATALSRPLIAQKVVEIAYREKAEYLAHGCTGKGNDQVRFELSWKLLSPQLKVIAPVREWEFKSRDEEMEYAREKGLDLNLERLTYSIDENLWGVSIECGELEDAGKKPPADAWQITHLESRRDPVRLKIEFDQGIPVALDEKRMEAGEIIVRLNEIGKEYAIGRKDLIEDRVVGIKSRELYEAPSAEILYIAHHSLETLVFDKDTLDFKHLVSLKYGELVYKGLWFSPLRGFLDRFVEATQKKVSGEVEIELHPQVCQVIGRKSRYSLYDRDLATYGQGSKFESRWAEGFIKILSMGLRKID
ncbi:MAG: argininosuccinate synthase [Candidatus Omnitrophota bacterium]|nr:MAG: argininosuccinate synthase [Candidatus Omnitrophota bacterium]